MKDSWIIGVISLVGLAFMGSLAWAFRERVFTGHNDFVQLYTGARLVGRPGLYDAQRVRREQQERIGATGEAWRYTRLPYYAALLWPLGRLPFRTAYALWELMGLAALAGFVWLWRSTSRPLTLLFTSLCLPVFTSLMNGQDLTLILLCLALAVEQHRRGWSFLAGGILSLCAAKYHLFVLLPLLVAGQKCWRLGGGLAAGGLALAGLSFAVAGPRWPWQYYEVLMDPAIHPATQHMPNLHGLFGALGPARWLEWPAGAAVAAMTLIVARRQPFPYALGATLAGGLLVSYHSYLPDCSVLLPAALTALATTTLYWLRLLAVVLLTPAIYFLLLMPAGPGFAVPCAILALLALMVWEAWRRPQGTDGRSTLIG